MEHFFIHCSKIRGFWTSLFTLIEGGSVCHLWVKELILRQMCLPLKKKKIKLWQAGSSSMLVVGNFERNEQSCV